ncbi:Replication initiator protein A [Bythopirellula polymerisocia]|uniref:Replication initiator protein A n=2 Tax=Bythopirellula polymerisocia TaxID=2528003 RepID=A0A5C6CBF4_9BACT|nr:Replication initiator protein A [Bythopirellula polymerisocia]
MKLVRSKQAEDKLVPLFGKDEMNLVEFPFGPISNTRVKTMEVEHETFDRTLKRPVARKMLITGSDAFGLPRPIDDQVLVGMKLLTHEAGYQSRRVDFSRYYLCKSIGWPPDGRAYRRLEESFDRIAGTTLKFKNAWWDKGEQEWKSKTFHLIEEVNLCSRDRLDRARAASGSAEQRLCSFVWTEVIWKSFQDGFIKTLNMELFRKIGQGRRREVPLRLFRILDKRFHHNPVAKFDLRRLAVGTLGLCPTYSPSQMARVLDRAAKWLCDCEYLQEMWYGTEKGTAMIFFRKRIEPRLPKQSRESAVTIESTNDQFKSWLASQQEDELFAGETRALESGFGSDFERRIVQEERSKGTPLLQSRRIRQEYVRRFLDIKAGAPAN